MGTASLALFVLHISLQGVPAFTAWRDTHIINFEELRFQDPRLTAVYSPWFNWVPRLSGMLYYIFVGFCFSGWLPHKPTWYTRYGAMSLYSYIMHWDVTGQVLVRWDMFHILPNATLRMLTSLLVLPFIMMSTLGGLLCRLLMWP